MRKGIYWVNVGVSYKLNSRVNFDLHVGLSPITYVVRYDNIESDSFYNTEAIYVFVGGGGVRSLAGQPLLHQRARETRGCVRACVRGA